MFLLFLIIFPISSQAEEDWTITKEKREKTMAFFKELSLCPEFINGSKVDRYGVRIHLILREIKIATPIIALIPMHFSVFCISEDSSVQYADKGEERYPALTLVTKFVFKNFCKVSPDYVPLNVTFLFTKSATGAKTEIKCGKTDWWPGAYLFFKEETENLEKVDRELQKIRLEKKEMAEATH